MLARTCPRNRHVKQPPNAQIDSHPRPMDHTPKAAPHLPLEPLPRPTSNPPPMAKTSDPLATPMMQQYLATKAEHPDCLLFMRMGDFFELFLDDAREAAQLLGITLTSRNKNEDNEIPMAGVPHHSLQGHLPKLLAAGRKVAIMDQLEDPAQAKGLVKRGLTRIITAGTLIDEDVLDDASANLLVAVTALDGLLGLAALDVSTGRFTVEEADGPAQLALALARLQPAELLLPEALYTEQLESQLQPLFGNSPIPPLASLPAYAWQHEEAVRSLCERLKVAKLEGFGISAAETHLPAAAAAVWRYAAMQACNELNHIHDLRRLYHGEHLVLDSVCRRNLDLLRAADGSRHGTLFQAVNRCRTAPGARLLDDWLARPLASLEPIRARHESVAFLLAEDGLREDLREQLAEVYDLERLLARVSTGRCNGRDLVQLGGTIQAAAACADRLIEEQLPPLLARLQRHLAPHRDLAEQLRNTLVEVPPLTVQEGGMIREGIDAEIDELRSLKQDAGTWLANYQAVEAERSGIPRIKVGYNKVFGYYLEVSRAHADKVPDNFVRKQTLVNAERYITPELKEYEDRALGAEDRIRAREYELFLGLRQTAEDALVELHQAAEALAQLDVLAGLAETARRGDWCCPTVDESRIIQLDGARHPVVERVIGREAFIANDVTLDGQAQLGPRLGLITGPNMAGKSTYIRQVALAVILAQAGSFVPAAEARIGLVDRLFTRIGAGDELAQGMSTFMVEMAETAAILSGASCRSLVVLDEVGRGTSTFDGVSLAWAITEHLHDQIGCRCLFATHYHELTDLADDRDGIANLTVAVSEQDNQVAFLHRIVPGAATKSYGLHVAKLAGVPTTVITRAQAVLGTLECNNVTLTETEAHPPRQVHEQPMQLSLFAPGGDSQTLKRLKALNVDEVSPRTALDLLYELQQAAKAE